MLIREIVLEGYQSDILTAVQDLLTNHMADDAKKIPTEQFQSELSKQGFVTTTDELIKAVNDSGYASSIDKDFIKPKECLHFLNFCPLVLHEPFLKVSSIPLH